jgi:hypothetical protein
MAQVSLTPPCSSQKSVSIQFRIVLSDRRSLENRGESKIYNVSRDHGDTFGRASLNVT